MSSVQKNHVSGGKDFVLRVKTQRTGMPAVVTVDQLVKKIAKGHGKRKDWQHSELAEIPGPTT